MKNITFKALIAASVLAMGSLLVLPALELGCTVPQQTATYKTLYSLETGATAAYNGYVASILAGQTTTNSLPAVSKAFNDFQAGMALAVAVNQANTNALAPAALVAEAAALADLIRTATGK